MALRGRALLESEALFKLKAKPGEGMCPVALCKGRSRTGTHACAGLCARHYQARWRALNPKKSVFATLRDHARERKIPFTICERYLAGLTDGFCFYSHSAATPGERLSIDRVRAHLGYVPGNCTIVTVSFNSWKSNRERYLPEHIQAVLERKRELVQEKLMEQSRRMAGKFADEEACPF